MGGGGGTTSYGTTNTKAEPWAGQMPALTEGYQAATDYLHGGTPNYYPNSTVADRSGATQGGIGALENFGSTDTYRHAWNGNADAITTLGQAADGRLRTTDDQGMAGLRATARGDYLTGGNPGYQDMVTRAIQAAQPGIASQFAASGRLGSGAYAHAAADSATNTAANLGYQDYSRERGYQDAAFRALDAAQAGQAGFQAQAAGALPGASSAFAQLGILPTQYALQGGQMDDARSQALTDADKARWDYNSNGGRLDLLRNYVALIQGNYGGATSGTQTGSSGNPYLQAAGAGAGLLGAAGQLGQGAKGLSNLFGGWGSSAPTTTGGAYAAAGNYGPFTDI